MTPAEIERLAILAEEMGEAIQVIGKILRHGYESSHPKYGDDTNRQLLETELGDVFAVISMMVANQDVDNDAIARRSQHKLEQHASGRYLHHQ